MSDIESVPNAHVIVNAMDNKITAALTILASVNEDLEEASGQMARVQEYFEGLAGLLNENGKPSYDEAVAAQKAEELTNQIAATTITIEEAMTQLEGDHENLEALSAQCDAVLNR